MMLKQIYTAPTLGTPRSRRPAVIVTHATFGGLGERLAPPRPTAPGPRKSVLPLLSELVEIQAITSAFETVAGRSAMIGFAAATAFELLLPLQQGAAQLETAGLFGGWEQAEAFGLLVAVLVSASAALAVASPMKMGRSLLEPVLASLTSRSRSAGAVTGRNVDRALDSAMDSVFSLSFVRRVFPIETEFALESVMESEFETDSEEISLF